MLPNRIHLSKIASEQLKLLKGRTGITPNILARIALARSIKEGFNYKLKEDMTLDGLEFQMPTLLGEYALLYERLLVELHQFENSNDLTLALAAHIENGLASIRSVKDLGELLSQLDNG
jgi:DNA sulfur modification protein DndE